MNNQELLISDPVVARRIAQEAQRQEETLSLIASENYAPMSVIEAGLNVLTNKYAEGYPGKRYYAGCAVVDALESLAIDRCKTLFHAEHANVQPHAGSQANMAVYAAVLKPGDTILGMSLAHGGHLTHGHAVNFSGALYRIVSYTVDAQSERIDYKLIEQLAHEHKPKLIIAGASAYSRFIDFERFGAIARSVGALLMADIAHIAGLVVTGLHPHPFPHADIVTSTTHKTLRGPRGGIVLCKQQFAQAIDRAIMPGTQGGPFMHTIAAKATAFLLAQDPSFATYQQQVLANAQALCATLSTLGYRIVTGGTDNHLFIVDLRNHGITGLAAELALEKAGITASRSCIPYDPEKPWITSGIRLGTPALTTRGMGVQESVQLAHLIDTALRNHDQESKLVGVKHEVQKLCMLFPIYATRKKSAQQQYHEEII
jgi:glycine hydroxymethyltransferase